MNYDEFAFFNEQLAGMLRAGIPLEGALKQLCAGMRGAALRAEVNLLGEDLARGTPLKEAVGRRKLPEFYRRMVEVGARSNDLPAMLTLLADHYHRANAVWTRLKGLLAYPLIVLTLSLILTTGLSILVSRLLGAYADQFPNPLRSLTEEETVGTGAPLELAAAVWTPPLVVALLAAAVVAAACVPSWRARLRWRLPAFREASLAELASAMALVLRNGCTLAEALALGQALEAGTPAERVLATWRALVESGQGKPAQWPTAARPIPPLFLWLVQQGGEDTAAGFHKAADIYYARASYRTEMALYGALPVSVLLLGQMVLWQMIPAVRAFVSVMDTLGRM